MWKEMYNHTIKVLSEDKEMQKMFKDLHKMQKEMEALAKQSEALKNKINTFS